MPKPVKLALATLSLLLLLFVAAALVVVALVSTESGTALLARQVQHNLGDSISWQRLSGSITGPLRISGMTFSQPGLSLTAEEINLDWSPSALLRGRLELSSFRAAGLDVILSPTPVEEPSPPFNPASIRAPVAVFLPEVEISDLHITQDGQSRQIDTIRLAGSLAGDSLTLDKLIVQAPEGELVMRGKTRLTSSMPIDLTNHWTYQVPESAPLAGESRLTGEIDWSDGIGFVLSYSLAANGLSSLQPDLPAAIDVSGNLGGRYLGNSLELEEFSLNQRDGALGLLLGGSIRELDKEVPQLSAVLTWQGLRWPLQSESADVESPQGEMRLTGSLDDYALELSLDLGGAAVPPGSWRATGTGTLTQLELESLQGRLLEGEINLQGLVGWDPVPRWQLQLEASGINPEALVAELPGELAARLSTRGEIGAGEQLQAHWQVQQVRGQLAGYPLNASGAGTVIGESIQITGLQLDSGRNRLSATGQVSAEALDLDWALLALAPGELLAGASGRISGRGKLTGTSESPRLNATMSGEELQLDTLQTATLTLNIAAGMQATDALELRLATGPLFNAGNALLQSLEIDALGSNADHQIDLKLDTGPEQLALELRGGLAGSLDAWSGVIASLMATSSEFGNWKLNQQSQLELSAASARLGDSCLARTDGNGQVCVVGNWSAEEGSDFALNIKALPVSLVQSNVSGDIDAAIDGQLAADGSISANGSVNLGAGKINLGDGQEPLEHGGGTLDLQVNQQGLNGQLVFAAPENGTVNATVRMPGLTSVPLADRQPLGGSIEASLPDLSGVAAWVPELAATGGAIDVDMQLAGDLSQPRVLGTLSLTNGTADIPLAGLQIRELQLQAQTTPARPDTLDIAGSMRSGKGSVELAGTLDMTDYGLQLALSGTDFQAYNTQDARILLSPDLEISWLQDTLTLRGEVFVPSADITPTIELNPAIMSEGGEQADAIGQAIAPSRDIVIVKGEIEGLEEIEMAAPFKIDNQVRLRLGDAVNINAVGFMGRLTGVVLFSNTPQQTELVPIANGKLSVEDGTFRSFGQDLDIRTGELLFNNKPATEPEINLRAVRWIENDTQVTSAGILLTGPITTPTMELFSRPQLETSEVQSYLITGRSTRDRNSVLSIGTYVTPRIYVGYGYNTLKRTSEFNSLFTITPRYGVGLNVGEADSNLNMTITYER